jgi:glycosidase
LHVAIVPNPWLPQLSNGGVRFRFAAHPDVINVAVAGTFNSWVGDSCLLEQIDSQTWQTILPIAPGRHLYKYVINGEQWIVDPANPWISEDAQNNSCFTVSDRGEVLIRAASLSAEHPGDLYLRHTALPSPAWLQDAVIYQLAVRAFAGDLLGMQQRLDYLSALGITVLWLMPLQPVGVCNRRGTLGDPYATYDFAALDSTLGDADALHALVAAAHQRGMRVILDWTLNRSSCDNPLTVSHPEWFTRDANGQIFYAVPNRIDFAGFDFRNRELRTYLITTMQQWIAEFDLDGLRFDDSDLTPLDFLVEIRTALAALRPEIGLISQSYDELHHLAACDLTYEGGVREVIWQIANRHVAADALQRTWEAATYSFPQRALRMRWLEEKEQGRAFRYYGPALHRAAATVLLTLDGVPLVLMGQEFNEPGWQNWTSLFEPFQLDWAACDQATFAHYQALIRLRHQHAVLRQGAVRFWPEAAGQVVGYWRGSGSERLLVVVNLSAEWVPLAADLWTDEVLYRDVSASEMQCLAPFGSLILRAPE